MKRLYFLFLWLLVFALPQGYGKDVDLGISLSDGKVRSFYLAIGDYFRVPEEEIIIIKKRYPVIVEDELPVLFLIVREARVSPDVVIRLRQRGYSWVEIMLRFGLRPEVVFERYIVYGPPYGKAWGYHKHHKRKIVLTDHDIIVLSNVKFISEYYQEPPEVVIRYKEKHPRFVDVHYVVYEEKKGKKKERFIEVKRVEDRGYYDSPLDRGPKFEADERDRKFKEKHKKPKEKDKEFKDKHKEKE
ncbi:MAG: hypothetical protein GU354_01390 [Caldimicrobium sp.]|jgi:hypothetical protein|nr:hypothetical protein [Caldimicrobium sp.]